MNDHEIDAEDAAIARALDQPGAPTDAETKVAGGTADLDGYREALARLPFEEVRPPPELGHRVIAAARRVRAPAIPSIDPAHRRSARSRFLPLVAAGAVAAAVALVVFQPRSSPEPGAGEAQIVAAPTPSELAVLLDSPGARRAGLDDPSGDPVGSVVLGTDGDGYLYDLALPPATSGTRYWLWVTVAGANVSAGDLGSAPSSAGFVIDGPADGLLLTLESDGPTPDLPGDEVAEGRFDSGG
ncbi:MAG: hypothetical protein M5T61_03120 [Acidimicrobiia bacterium]|nr:hypothetical protein [Acidimicrobiia bacterium]